MLVIFDIFMLELRKFYLAIFTNDILKKFTGGLIIGLDLVSHIVELIVELNSLSYS